MTGKKRFIMAGGGTGGHIFPAIAIANAIVEAFPEAEFLFVGARGKMEMEKVPEAGYRIEGLTIAGFDRGSLIKNISLPFKLVKSFFQVADIFRKFNPDAVIGVGGYSSFPVLKYAQARGIPTFIHESNSFAGKSNILLGKKATKIFTSCEGMEKFFPADKVTVSGNPVRKNIAAPVSRKEALSFFGLSEERKTLLIVGGSLGARSINEAIDSNLEQLDQAGVQVIWQTGKPFHEKARLRGTAFNWVRVYDFLNRMDLAYKAADVVISRSGAMAVSELCIAGKPVIFVPFPHAAEDHQTSNAKRLVEKEAAIMIKDEEVKSLLMPRLLELLKDEALQQKLKENILKLAVWDADKSVAEKILKALN
jgi:UDP-N-acetylglucosamine--N-acetylmuramyl-(pentapeptide) pyrophosphoryl-undecaprenol N-acetylglucosamine transferase